MILNPHLEGPSQPCGTDEGQCVAGTKTCQPDLTWGLCEGVGPAPEACNGLDDDCDGQTDEDFGLGAPCGLGTCASALACTSDGTGTWCTGGQTPRTELCDGLDDDCDGQTDEDFGLGAPCGLGVCAGALGCTPDGMGTECAGGGTSRAERCDGRDDDCDGATDEGFQYPQRYSITWIPPLPRSEEHTS